MLWLNPNNVRLDGDALGGVRSVSVSRGAGKSVIDHGDEGPHVVFADVPEQKVEIRVEREVSDGASAGAEVGDAVVVTFETALGSGDAARRRVTITGVVLTSEFAASGSEGGRAKLKLIGVSSDGTTDPVSIEQVG